MAQSIEDFAAPLLAKAKKANKKMEKRVRNQNYALLGVKIANQALRARALNRAQSWYAGAQPILRQARDNAQAGFNFWSDHNEMLGKHDSTDWRVAKAQQLFNTAYAEQGKHLTEEEKKKAFAAYMPTIKDQLDAYDKQMKLHSEFKGATTEKEKEILRKRYYGSIDTMLTNETARIKNDNSIFSAVTGALGITGRDRLDDIDAIAGIPQTGLSPKEQEISDFFANAQLREKEALGLTEASKRSDGTFNWNTYSTTNLATHEDVYGRFQDTRDAYIVHTTEGSAGIAAIETDLEPYGGITIKLQDQNKNEVDIAFHQIVDLLPDTGPTGADSPQTQFIDDVTELASILEYKYDKAAEAAATAGGLSASIARPRKQDFLKAATEMVVNDGRFVFEQNKLLPNKLTYESYDKATLTRIANEEHSSLLSKDTAKEIFKDIDIDTGNQEELEAILEEQAQSAAMASASASNRAMAKVSVNDFIEAIEDAKKDPNYNKTETEKLRDTWINSRKRAGTWTQEDEDKIMAIQLSATTVPTLSSTSGTIIAPRSGPGRKR